MQHRGTISKLVAVAACFACCAPVTTGAAQAAKPKKCSYKPVEKAKAREWADFAAWGIAVGTLAEALKEGAPSATITKDEKAMEAAYTKNQEAILAYEKALIKYYSCVNA